MSILSLSPSPSSLLVHENVYDVFYSKVQYIDDYRDKYKGGAPKEVLYFQIKTNSVLLG